MIEKHKYNTSNTNLNEEENRNSIVQHTISRKKKFIIIGSISFVVVALAISLICYFKFHKKDDQKKTIINT